MDIKYMKAFIAFAETNNLTKAAAAMGVSKSVLWKHLQQVETELGIPLLKRSGRHIVLNEDGQRFLETARCIMNRVDRCAQSLKKNREDLPEKQKLRIGAFQMMTPYGITDTLIGFKQLRPDIEIRIHQDDEELLEVLLEDQKIELMYLRSWTSPDSRYESQLACIDEGCIVLPITHPLAGRERLSWSDLKNERFLLIFEGGITYRECWKRCEEAGFRPTVGGTFTYADTVLRMVGQGLGISFLLQRPSARLGYIPGIVYKRLTPSCRMNIYLAHLRKFELSRTAAEFWEYAKRSGGEDD